MGKELDLDDVAAQSPLAMRELAELRLQAAETLAALRGAAVWLALACDADKEMEPAYDAVSAAIAKAMCYTAL